ncbi:MAG: ribulose-phosphate 3-epimerase [Actinomycetota bacterium]|nr:ribulose-phosphate 3-epimerase [Actinomycetota bacterium]
MPGLERLHGVAPSILSADFARLAAQVEEVMAAGARIIHCDVMDGHFVPPITFGPLVVGALREALPPEAVLDVHLMIERPERHVAEFAKAGADNITIHVEATPHVHYTVNAIREAGATAGVALNPGTAVEALGVDADLVLCMTVNPGWGGQPFIRGSEERIAALRARAGDGVPVEVDGGIDARTAGPCAAAGATTFVAGSAIFGAPDPAEAFREISAAAGCGQPYPTEGSPAPH